VDGGINNLSRTSNAAPVAQLQRLLAPDGGAYSDPSLMNSLAHHQIVTTTKLSQLQETIVKSFVKQISLASYAQLIISSSIFNAHSSCEEKPRWTLVTYLVELERSRTG
jgi:hypothetical protein